MNAPTHLVCGALAAHAVASLVPREAERRWQRSTAVAIAALAAGVATHLLLDLAPHYAWIVHLDWFDFLPYHWLIREAVCAGTIAMVALIIARREWPMVLAGMAGAACPDIEKVLSVDFRLPDALVLFDWHSTYLSSRTGGHPKEALIAVECALIVACLVGMLILAWRQCRSTGT